jgi:uncharacterized alkaline shock family protein YloU
MEMIVDFERTELGRIEIAPEVIEVIAGLAAGEVDGVAHMSGGFVGDIAERLGRKNLSKGVKVEVGKKEAAIDVYIIVNYGYRIPEVARNIQDNVRHSIENMTGLTVIEVNVHVVDVEFKQEKKIEIEEPISPSRVR